MGKSTQTQTSEMDPLQKEYMEKYIMPQAEAVKGMEFTPFTGDRVSGMTDLQRQAQAGYAGLGVPEQYGQAGSVFSEIAGMTPEQRAADIAQYTQQYTAGVIDPTIAMMERERAKARTGEEAAIAKAGAFGSRGDVLRGEREGEYQARMGQTLGQLQQQGYQQAVARQQAEAAQRLGAAGQIGVVSFSRARFVLVSADPSVINDPFIVVWLDKDESLEFFLVLSTKNSAVGSPVSFILFGSEKGAESGSNFSVFSANEISSAS